MTAPARPEDEAAIAAYLDELAHQRRQSPLTISNYRRDLHKLLGDALPPLDRLQPHDIRRRIGQLHGQGLGGRSIARHLSAWRGFFTWLGRQGRIALNPCDGIRPPKAPKRLPKALSVDEAARLLSPPAEAGDELLSLRDSAMFELFYSSGLRLAELAQLDVDALADLRESGEMRVLGKRSKARIVPVGDMARRAIERWAAVRANLAAPEEPALFVSQRGKRLGHRAIELRLAARARQQELPQHVHPHMLRHAFASHVLQSSGDLRAVQEMLGHASLASTQIYTQLDFQHLARVYDTAHPRAKRRD